MNSELPTEIKITPMVSKETYKTVKMYCLKNEMSVKDFLNEALEEKLLRHNKWDPKKVDLIRDLIKK